MLTNPWLYIIVLAFALIIGLSFYAGKLLMKVKQQTLLQAQAKIDHQRALNKHDSKILNSVIIIVRAMKEEQCDLSEGCWRLSVLLDSLKTCESLHHDFPAIFELYNEIKHMPILEARKKLDKKARMTLDFTRIKLEAKLAPSIKGDIEKLHTFSEKKLADLS